jgi:hypothetical protein
MTPVSVRSCLRRLARPRCLRERLTTVGLRPRCCHEVDVNGSKDRVKDASPIDDGFSIEDGCLRFVAPADVVPLLGGLRTSAVIGALLDGGRRPASSVTDRPRSSFERRPAKSDAVPKTGMPFTATSKEEGGGKSAISPFVGSLAHAAHTLPRGSCFFRALQGHGAVTRGSVTCSRKRAPSWSRKRVPGADVPSSRSRSTGEAVGEDRLPRSHRTGRSALTGSTTESPRPDVPRTS